MTIPSVKEAHRLVKKAEEDRKAAEKAEERRVAKVEEQIRKNVDKSLPQKMEQVGETILKAIRDQKKSVHIYASNGYEMGLVNTKLTELGYTVGRATYHPAESGADYGYSACWSTEVAW